ncbi:MAG TPA: FdhF/YdeP family oxidoreductase [Candidatus Limnocylindria bacterium]|nr:FdhF/YdeP family oxidoreductase [Candidatus Limnocylindria bacterium]
MPGRRLPFGLGQTKPHHFRGMARVAWENRDRLGYAWKILSRGVCDGCALGTTGLRDWTIDGIHLCMTRLHLLRLNTMPALDPAVLVDVRPLAGRSNAALRALGRLPVPLRRRRGEAGFRPIAWDDALAAVAARIRTTRPERFAFYLTARGLTNETYYVAQKAARLLGTNNIDNAARLCHSPSTAAMTEMLGTAASTCSYRDWLGTDLIVFVGSNPANDQPVAIKYLERAKRLGTAVAMVNPYREPGMERYWVPSIARSALFGTDVTDHWFTVRTGGDVAFLTGVAKVMIERGWFDARFVTEHATGFTELAVHVRALGWEALEADAGLSRADMERLAVLLRDADTAVLVWSMGVTQHAHGGDAVRSIVNLALLRGFVGRARCGLMPIRGHSGVQGGAEMGAYATALPGGRPITPEAAAELERAWGFRVPTTPGLTAPEMVEAAARGELDVLYSVGGNLLHTLPDTAWVASALGRVPCRVHQDIVLTDQMLLEPADEVVLLPAQTRYEQSGGGTETTTERRIVFSPEIPRQVGAARAEWRILRDLACAAVPEAAATFGCADAAAIRAEIARIVPFYAGIERLAAAGDSVQWGGPHLCTEWRFPTNDGKARFRVVPLPVRSALPGTFALSTRRGKQFNTLVYAETDPLTGAPRDAVLMNPDDAAERRLRAGDVVTLASEHGRFTGRVFLAPIARGDLQVHWPEGNVLIGRGARDATGGVPDYNARVRLEVGAP